MQTILTFTKTRNVIWYNSKDSQFNAAECDLFDDFFLNEQLSSLCRIQQKARGQND